jgi:spore maturation protein CgeB
MNIAFFGSSLVSADGNGAATYVRGIVRALANRGHRVVFFEPDGLERQAHRDLDDPSWATVVVYPPTVDGVQRSIDRARGADLVVKASGVGVHDALLEAAVLSLQGPRTIAAFWDVDAPATLDRADRDPCDPFRALIPRYDLVFSNGGGAPVVDAYRRLGARRCVPIYNALDPSTHFPVPADPRFAGALGFLGDRLPDRERRVEELFLRAAAALPASRFVLGGAGWENKPLPGNVRRLGHVYPREHNAFDVSPLAVLDVDRDRVASYGYAPATRIFEAAGAGACLITDAGEGLAQFLEPGREVLSAKSGDEVAAHVAALTPERARTIGERARQRVLAEHTYQHRAIDVETALAARRRVVAPPRRLEIVILGLSITSSWGSRHATTYRGLVRELARRGHQVLFLERDVPGSASHRDLPAPTYARVALYQSLPELRDRFERAVRNADLVIVGSSVPDGAEVGRWVLDTARHLTAFYDLDTPVTLARIAAGDHAYLSPALIRRYAMYLSFTGGPTLTRIERDLGSPRARPLYGSVDPSLYFPETRPRRWDLGYLGTYRDDRQPALERLLIEPARREGERRFVVAGPEYPREIEWPPTVARIEHLAPPDHRGFYNQMAFALHVTRRDRDAAGWSPSVRLFEASACGVPIISDRWDGIDELFVPGRELLLADGADDVQRILRDTDESARQAIGERGRARVLSAHTAAHRAADLEAYVLES